MPHHRIPDDFGVDSNGCLTETFRSEGQTVVLHYADIPESDITTVDGLPCTTALRTVIDIAPQYDRRQLDQALRQCLDRKLFTIAEALERIAQPDMENRAGAVLLGRAIRDLADPGRSSATV